MEHKMYPVIDMYATGRNIQRLRRERGLTVRDLQNYFGFEDPRAIYKWQQGKSIPSVDNLYALSALLEVPMEDILVNASCKLNIRSFEQYAEPGCSVIFYRLLQLERSGFYAPVRLTLPVTLGALT